MTTKQLLSSNSYIQFPKFLGAHIGPNEALLLSVFCDVDSWCNFNVEDYDGWFYILQNDILWETGLSEKQQRAALSHLYELNIIYIEKRDVPAKNYYFINTNELENVLNDAYINYKAHKTQMLQNVTSRPNKMSYQDTTKNSVSSINTKNKNIKINNKSAGSAVALSKNHSQVYKKREILSDDLESGKAIDEQKKEKKKLSEEEKAYKKIDKTSYSEEIKDMLKQFFSNSYHSTSERRMRHASDLDSRLTKLNNLVKSGQDMKKILQQSLDFGYHSFWEINSNNSSHHEIMQDSVKTRSLEEAQQAMNDKLEKGALIF